MTTRADIHWVNGTQGCLRAKLRQVMTPVARLVDLTDGYSGHEVAKLCATAFDARLMPAEPSPTDDQKRRAKWTPFEESHFLHALLQVRSPSLRGLSNAWRQSTVRCCAHMCLLGQLPARRQKTHQRIEASSWPWSVLNDVALVSVCILTSMACAHGRRTSCPYPVLSSWRHKHDCLHVGSCVVLQIAGSKRSCLCAGQDDCCSASR